MRDEASGMPYACACVETAFGWIGLVGSERGLVELVMPAPSRAAVVAEISPSLMDQVMLDDSSFVDAAQKLRRYFAGEKVDLSVLSIDESVGTPFQRRVWQVLRAIPYGSTVSYGEVARRIGQPSAPRAVGGAVGSNPLPIIVPCHRVLAANGKIGGFAGGLDLKRRLLALEGIRV